MRKEIERLIEEKITLVDLAKKWKAKEITDKETKYIFDKRKYNTEIEKFDDGTVDWDDDNAWIDVWYEVFFIAKEDIKNKKKIEENRKEKRHFFNICNGKEENHD